MLLSCSGATGAAKVVAGDQKEKEKKEERGEIETRSVLLFFFFFRSTNMGATAAPLFNRNRVHRDLHMCVCVCCLKPKPKRVFRFVSRLSQRSEIGDEGYRSKEKKTKKMLMLLLEHSRDPPSRQVRKNANE